jgi:hypothetical protein
LAGLPFLPGSSVAQHTVALSLCPGQAPIQISVQTQNGGGRIGFENQSSRTWAFIDLPSTNIVLSGRLVVAGRELLLATFPAGPSLDVLAIIGWDDTRIRLLALEPIAVHAPTGLALSVRVAANAQEFVLRFTSELSAPRGPTLPFHLRWIDWLGFRPHAPLFALATRPPLPGGCQARLADIRARVVALLMGQADRVTWSDLAATELLDVPQQLALATHTAYDPSNIAAP